MRILHTADLHLGRQFNGIALDADHETVLSQIVDALIDHRADVLVIAGDIYDRASPPATAVKQFNAFLKRVARETDAAVVMIAGNHDSGDRIAAMSIMADTQRSLIRGALEADEKPLVLADEHGPVAFSGLPFAYEYAARECFADETIAAPHDVIAAQMATARRNLPEGARWVVVAHAFVEGATGSDSERPLTRVGGIETVGAEVFSGAHYVALGHLHKPQDIGPAARGRPRIRYCGSPLAFGFDEAESEKSMSLVEIDGDGAASVQVIPFSPPRRVRVLRGKHAELLLAEPSGDFVKLVLSDETPVIDAMKRIRKVFPNACELTYARAERAPEVKALGTARLAVASPTEIAGDFLQMVRGEALSEAEGAVLAAALGRIADRESAE